MCAVAVSASAGTHTLKWHRLQTSFYLALTICQLVCEGLDKYVLEERPKPSIQHPPGALCTLHAQQASNSRQQGIESPCL